MPLRDPCAISRLFRAVAAVCTAVSLRTAKASRGLCQVAMLYEYGVGARQVMQIIVKHHLQRNRYRIRQDISSSSSSISYTCLMLQTQHS